MIHDRRGDEHAGDATVDTAWRKASNDEPSPQVDAAILAAARAEVRREVSARQAPTRQPWWSRWQPLAAAASVVGLAFVLVQMLPREETLHAPLPTQGAPQISDAPARQESAGNVLQENAATERAVEPATAPPAASSPAPSSIAAPGAAKARVEMPASVPPPEPAAARSTVEPVAARLSPDAWARRIAALHTSGDVAAAADELRAFRRAYPNADERLPQLLRSWAASVGEPDEP